MKIQKKDTKLTEQLQEIHKKEEVYEPIIRIKQGGMEQDATLDMPFSLFSYTRIKGYKPEMTLLYLCILRSYEREDNCAYPSQDELAKLYGKDTRTLQRHLVVLEKFGLVRIIGYGGGQRNLYVPLKPKSLHELIKANPELKLIQ
ncbi:MULTISPECIES: helix-turn-helix domain-containing protein [Bacillaceae]|nr:helix-turn-helix domain-containing protein [Bacillus cereus]MEB9442224.1 helix-turn-helix domain-containing protein [Bacillus cereus]BCA37449.1 hypothetical protein BwiPL1_58310 [Bacillus wiedmannii]